MSLASPGKAVQGLVSAYKFARGLAVATALGSLLAVSLVTLGIVTTDHLIGPNLGNGLGGLVGEEYYSGQSALRNAQSGCGGSRDDGRLAEWFLRHKFRLVEVQMLDGVCPLEGRNAVQAYQARVQSYTMFMIPTSTAFVQCSRDGGGAPLKVFCSGPPED